MSGFALISVLLQIKVIHLLKVDFKRHVTRTVKTLGLSLALTDLLSFMEYVFLK